MESTMLTADGCLARRQRLWDATEEDLDIIVVFHPHHLMYLANYYADPFVFRSVNSGAALILSKSGESIFVADSMVKAFANKAHADRIVIPTWYDGKHSAPPRGLHLVRNVLDALRELPGRRIGIESAHVPAGIVEGLLRDRPDAAFSSIDQSLHRMKRQKDVDELALIFRSISAIEQGFAAARIEIRPEMTELEAFRIIQRASGEALGGQMPIYGDFVSGENSIVGGAPGDRVIQAEDLFLLDYSVVVYGYRGDFANTWVVSGKATDAQRRLHDACLEALQAGEKWLRPGTPARQVDLAIRDSFAAKGLAEGFNSHSGHGLGLGHPDPPYLVPASDDILMEGDVIALEPSQVIPGIGCIRTENNYLITSDGFQQLSHHELTIDSYSGHQ